MVNDELKLADRGWTMEEAKFKLSFLELKVEQLDHKISRKADDIVSFQVLQHRNELEAIYETLHSLNNEIKRIDTALTELISSTRTGFTTKDAVRTKEALPSL